MPNTTYGTPYAQSSDLVSNWPGVSLNVADRIDDISFKGNGLNDQTGTSYTLVLTDAGKTVTLNNAAAVAVTIPTNASVAYETGTIIRLANKGAGTATISPTGGVTLNGGNITVIQNQSAAIIKLDTNTWQRLFLPVTGGLNYITQSALSGSTVSLNSIFSATYTNYKLMMYFTRTATFALQMRFRTSGTDNSSNTYYSQVWSYDGTTTGSRRQSPGTLLECTLDTSNGMAVQFDIYQPFASAVTYIHGTVGENAARAMMMGGAFNNTTSFDGLSLFTSASTFASGLVRVYGYQDA